MGFYYGRDGGETPGAADEKPPGCMDVLLITRAVFAIVLPFLGLLIFIFVIIGAMFWAFAQHPALVAIPIAIAAFAIWLFSRWEQRTFRPPDL